MVLAVARVVGDAWAHVCASCLRISALMKALCLNEVVLDMVDTIGPAVIHDAEGLRITNVTIANRPIIPCLLRALCMIPRISRLRNLIPPRCVRTNELDGDNQTRPRLKVASRKLTNLCSKFQKDRTLLRAARSSRQQTDWDSATQSHTPIYIHVAIACLRSEAR